MKDVVRSQYRLPVEVDAWLKMQAERDGRTKNSMLVALLKKNMSGQKENASSAGTGEALMTQ
ncbi:hypothetical protein QCE49_28050 [Caballeronia sp. LZ008]|uniref:hypothetical protein n=1 Tax=unclassified Caballeronia TaxID=2646786 RepID=UPI002028EFCF|nr:MULTISPECIES: hypothetical protein [unclassified Caballeronia]MDR5797254.1 hypothetical protein [Caballeronia sp. LZ008]